MATTFAIVAVFMPVAFMSGIIGRFFFQFGITVAVAVLVSLFVSFTLDPMLSAIWRDPPEARFRRVPWLGRVMAWIERGVDGVHELYGRVLGWALGHRKNVIAIAVVTFVASFASCRWSAPSSCRRPTRASSRCASTRRWARASSTPTPRCARSRRRCKPFREIDLAMTTSAPRKAATTRAST